MAYAVQQQGIRHAKRVPSSLLLVSASFSWSIYVPSASLPVLRPNLHGSPILNHCGHLYLLHRDITEATESENLAMNAFRHICAVLYVLDKMCYNERQNLTEFFLTLKVKGQCLR
jgi:hypothetical protein